MGQYKLDINSYLGREEINKTSENDYVSGYSFKK